MKDYLFILIQICLSLHVAQKICGFVHYDLAPWNIIIQKLSEPVTFEYVIDYKTVYRIKTQIVPIIIDMGRSHVIHDDCHYGDINMFSTSTIQDVVAILATTIYEVSSFDLDSTSVNDIIILANFLTRTGYRQHPFTATGKGGLGDIRFFFNKAKKYTELVNANKFDLETKTPLHLVDYITKNFRYKFSLEVTNSVSQIMTRGNSRQVFEYILSSTNEEKALSFVKVFNRVQSCDLPDPTNLFLVYYTAQTMVESLESVSTLMLRFLDRAKIDSDKYMRKYEKIIEIIEKKYRDTLNTGKESKIKYEIQRIPRIIYDENTFLFPAQLLDLLKKVHEVEDLLDLTEYKDIIEGLLLRRNTPFVLPDSTRTYYEDNFAELLQTNSLHMKTDIANVVTLRYLAREVATNDSTEIKKLLQGENGDCEAADTYLRQYREILDFKV